MCSKSIFLCIMTMISNFTICFILHIFLYKYDRFLNFHITLAALLLITSFFVFLKLIISVVCFLNDSQNVLMQSLPTYTSYLFIHYSHDDIIAIEKLDGICSLTFVVDEFSGLLLHPAFFSIKHSRRSAQVINCVLSIF